MPILRISSRIVSFANCTSRRLSGPAPFVGSEPRKKLRQTLISGTVYTIATRAVQVRQLPAMIKFLFARAESKDGTTSFQAFAMALGGRVGVGNIAGVATAIAFGRLGGLVTALQIVRLADGYEMPVAHRKSFGFAERRIDSINVGVGNQQVNCLTLRRTTT